MSTIRVGFLIDVTPAGVEIDAGYVAEGSAGDVLPLGIALPAGRYRIELVAEPSSVRFEVYEAPFISEHENEGGV